MNDDLINRIRALRNKAADASVTEAEAALFAAKAAELLAKYGLSMADVAEEARDDGVMEENYEMMYSDPWRVSLFFAIERLYFCFSFRTKFYVAGKLRSGVVIVGRPHNVITTRETYEYLEQTTLRLAQAYSRSADVENDIRLGGTTTRAARIGFERGCGERLAQRVLKLYREQARPEDQSSGSGLPVLYRNERALAETFAREKHSLRSTKSRGSSINDHGGAGIRAAEGVSLSRQISGGTGGRLLR